MRAGCQERTDPFMYLTRNTEGRREPCGLKTSFFHGWNGRNVLLIQVVKSIFYDGIVLKERL